MNQISSALAAAGVKLPSAQQRIWNYVKDHPDVTARRVQQELPVASVSSLMSQMVDRGLLRAEKKPLRLFSGKGYIVKRVAHFYALGESYDPKSARKPANLPTTVCAPAQVGHRQATSVVDGLTVAQARELWQILDRMFGSGK